MLRRRVIPLVVLAAAAAGVWGASRQSGSPEGRPAASILADYHAVRSPGWLEGDDPAEVAAFHRAVEEGAMRQAALALEMWRSHPSHEQTPQLLLERWRLLCNTLGLHSAVDEEAAYVLRTSDDPRIERVARWGRAQARVDAVGLTFDERLVSILDAVEDEPNNATGAYLLYRLATTHGEAAGEFASTLGQLVERYPHSDEADDARQASALLARVGTAFVASVHDTRSGAVWNSSAHTGRVFVWHVWRHLHGKDLVASRERLAEFRRRCPDLDVVSVCLQPKYATAESIDAALAAVPFDGVFLVPGAEDAERLFAAWPTPRSEWYTLIGSDGRVLATASALDLLRETR